ncbi:hypothetical protein HMPREF9336_04247 [Segniliparus rugosus ATCC BAA-974]|uniref:Uncharacterized protein n=1 Tax=Segniliparus rugosus (strain ATCC BAA-974 / DSM 45345 / CCUG 50838 / CIP 108380 / JCM 13579 / CDC 945) TaxID=679197 RepID=U1N899_SEGRC|nr:hypothetical protein HMPREF9336_04247 [Segniliparus rugosus ATCC BAA-974]
MVREDGGGGAAQPACASGWATRPICFAAAIQYSSGIELTTPYLTFGTGSSLIPSARARRAATLPNLDNRTPDVSRL